MTTSISIPKNPVYPTSMDWTLLRREGMRHIERLGSKIWTDYNLHDPGITLLEILCYAITDLGYRSNLDAKDLFADQKEGAFYTAQQVLPNGPITALDYRKLLIDIPGVRNAWVAQMQDAEVRFYLGSTTQTLKDPLRLVREVKNFLRSRYKPLMEKVFTDKFFPLDLLKDLFTELIDRLVENTKCLSEDASKKLKQDLLGLLPDWEKINGDISLVNLLLLYIIETKVEVFHFSIQQKNDEIQKEELKFFNIARQLQDFLKDLHRLQLLYQGALSKKEKRDLHIEISHLIKGNGEFGGLNAMLEQLWELNLGASILAKLKEFIHAELLCFILKKGLRVEAINNPLPSDHYNLFIPQGIYQICIDIEEGYELRSKAIQEEALNRMNGYRNLGEDFVPEVEVIEKKDLGLILDLEIESNQDTQEVLLKIYEKVQSYLIPQIRFYSLEAMLNKYATFWLDERSINHLRQANLPVEILESLEGIKDEKWVGINAFYSYLKSILSPDYFNSFADDIFVASQKLYDSDGVYQGPLLRHGFIDEAELINAAPRQTVYRSDLYQLISSVEGVKSILFLNLFDSNENNDPKSINWCLEFDCKCLARLNIENSRISVDKGAGKMDVDSLELAIFIETNRTPNNKIDRSEDRDLSVPQGTYYSDLKEYTSIQEDFPKTYKIGKTGIAKSEKALRKAQAKQLQAYLLFFDQLLANYLARLSNAKHLLSLKGQARQSFQALYDIPGIKDLLMDFDPSKNWDNFIQNEENNYNQTLKKLAQGKGAEYQILQNKILDHLLSRFGEQFSDQALDLYQIERSVNRGALIEGNIEKWIRYKQRMIEYLPILSAGRGLGFNYRAEEAIWNILKFDEQGTKIDLTPEESLKHILGVSGLKRRVCAYLGIEDWSRHTISCEPAFFVESDLSRPLKQKRSSSKKYFFFIKEKENSLDRLLESVARFSTEEALERGMADFIQNAADQRNYGIVDDRIGFWTAVAPQDRSWDNAIMLEPNPSLEGIEERLNHLKNLASANCQDDGFHIVEHILLRPKNEFYEKILNPFLCCSGNLEKLDPYSFWITIVVPNWVDRFNTPKLFELFKQTVRKEAPAHLALRFVQLSRADMLSFEIAYNKWLIALCENDEMELPALSATLTTLMNNWDISKIDNA